MLTKLGRGYKVVGKETVLQTEKGSDILRVPGKVENIGKLLAKLRNRQCLTQFGKAFQKRVTTDLHPRRFDVGTTTSIETRAPVTTALEPPILSFSVSDPSQVVIPASNIVTTPLRSIVRVRSPRIVNLLRSHRNWRGWFIIWESRNNS